MVSDLVKTYHSVSDEQKSMFGTGKGEQEVLGKCPKCGADVVKGKFGAYCTGKCGMNVGKAFARPQWGQVLERGYKKKKSRAKI